MDVCSVLHAGVILGPPNAHNHYVFPALLLEAGDSQIGVWKILHFSFMAWAVSFTITIFRGFQGQPR